MVILIEIQLIKLLFMYVLTGFFPSIFFFSIYSCTFVDKGLFDLGCLGPSLQRSTVSEPDANSLLNGNTEIEHVSRLLNLDRNRFQILYSVRLNFNCCRNYTISVGYFITSDFYKKMGLLWCRGDKDPKSCENSLHTV
ncbi:hypothetical protein P5673_021622, partial [Acropora cervicornis]